MHNRSLIFFTSLVFGLAGTSALAEEGVTKDRIVFGQVAALEGPAQALGQGMRQGLLAAFAEANRAGGIAGRQLELKSADDSYEPQKMIEAMKKMLGEDNVFAIVGPVGTPTANAGQPIATEAKVGAFTGAEFLRNPHKRYVVNVRSSYFQETEAWIERLTNDLGITRIAILYQDDTFGLAGLNGARLRWPSATCRSWLRAHSGATRRR
jgi:branched-chain amino acid transport system substrate-binding protein